MILTFIVVSCDVCCEELDPEPDFAEARRQAKKRGWRLGKHRMAMCPACQAKAPTDGGEP